MMQTVPSGADRVLVAINPHAGWASRRVDRLARLLSRHAITTLTSSDLDHLCGQANELYAARRLRALVAVGGDGTATELVNRTAPGLPIAIMPAGNANLLAKHFRLFGSLERLSQMIVAGTAMRLDAGRVGDRIFLLMASCGFDAEVVRRVHAYRQVAGGSRRVSYRSYFGPIIQSLRNYTYPGIRVYWDEPCDADDRPGSVDVVRWVFAFNLPLYGWGLALAPSAAASDGWLDVCTFAQGSIWSTARYLAAAQLGRHQAMRDCIVRRVRRFRMVAQQPVPYQLDGDPGGYLPVEVEVVPGRWTLLVPPEACRP